MFQENEVTKIIPKEQSFMTSFAIAVGEQDIVNLTTTHTRTEWSTKRNRDQNGFNGKWWINILDYGDLSLSRLHNANVRRHEHTGHRATCWISTVAQRIATSSNEMEKDEHILIDHR